MKAWSKAFRFTYETTDAAGNDLEIAAYGLGLEGELGWQFIREDWRVAVYAGAV